jgi:ketosteroid isomerase-like protein
MSTPDFDAAVQAHLDAITQRDIAAFARHMTRGEKLFTIVQNGHAFTTPEEIIAVHEAWFKDPHWIWEGTVVHTVVGADVAMALIKYDYRARPEHNPVSSWLTYVFQLQDGAWRIVHDQNTSLDYPAFARAAGLPL